MKSLFKSWPDRIQLLVDQLLERCNRAMEVESRQQGAPNLEPMEERIMMSASPMAAAVDGGAESMPENQAATLIFVDETVQESEAISRLEELDSNGGNIHVITLNSDRDGIEQISEALEAFEGVEAIHILSHGNETGIQLGSTFLDNSNLAEYASTISSWNQSLTSDADLLLYGCNLAGSESGHELLEGLSLLSGADVAASDDLTGHESLGGDWELEYSTGSIEHGVIFSQDFQSNWSHVLEVSVDATTATVTAENQLTETVSHTTSGTERLLLVGISFGTDNGSEVDSITYAGQSLTRIGVQDHADDTSSRVEIWSLVAPDLGTHDLVVEYSGSHQGATVGVVTLNGVDQAMPLGDFASNQGTGTNLSVEIDSMIGKTVFSIAAVQNPESQLISGIDQTEFWQQSGDNVNGAGTLQRGAENVSAAWTTTSSQFWTAAGVSINPSAEQSGLVTRSESLVNESANNSQTTASIQNQGGEDAVAINELGDYVVVWTDNAKDGSGPGIFAQRFDQAGNRLGSEIAVNSETLNSQQHASVGIDAAGRFAVVWRDDNTGEIKLRRFNEDGTAIDASEFTVAGSLSEVVQFSTLSVNREGQIVVAWQGVGGSPGIFARTFDMQTDLTDPNIDAISPTIHVESNNSATRPSVDLNDSGRFVVAWQGSGQLFARQYDFETGTAFGSTSINLTPGDFSNRQVDVALREDNNFVIAYVNDISTGQGIWTSSFDENGVPTAPAFDVDLDATARAPQIGMDAEGNFVITYEKNDEDLSGVYARKFDSNGDAQGGFFRVNETRTGNQYRSSVAVHSADNFVVVWSGNGEQTGQEDSEGVFSRQFGTLLQPAAVASNEVVDADLSANTVAEDAQVGDDTGLTATFAGPVSEVTFSLVRDGDGRFAIDATTGAVMVAGELDFESASQFTVLVEAVGSNGEVGFKEFTIEVTNVNEAPVAVSESYLIDEGGTLNTLGGEWWNNDYRSRLEVVIDNTSSSSELVDFPVLVTLDGSQIDYTKTQNAGEDLRFIDQFGRELSYEIETWNEGGTSSVWVRAFKIPAGETESLWLYYDNPDATAASFSEPVWANHYQGVYHLNDDRLDSSENDVDPVSANTMDAVGIVGDGERFDGDTSFINLGTNEHVDDLFDGGGTVSAWVNLDSYGENGFGRIFDKASGTVPSPNGWSLSVDQTGPNQGRLIFEQGYSNDFGRWITDPGTIGLSTWHHVAVVFDSSVPENDPVIYIDGLAVNTIESQTPNGDLLSDSGLDLALGNHVAGGNRGFDGVIDEARLSSDAVSADWIAAEFGNLNGLVVSQGAESLAAGQLSGVLTGDYDPDGDMLTLSEITGPEHGDLSLNPDGSFTYVHDGSENFTDSFTYGIADGNGGVDQAVVNITINDLNDAPTIQLDNLVDDVSEFADTSSSTKVADVVITDDAVSANQFSLTGADADLFELTNNNTELHIKAGTELDHETNPVLDVNVVVEDPTSISAADSADHSINVTDVNESPTLAISALRSSIAENADTTNRIKVADIVVSDDSVGSNEITLSGSDAAMFELSANGSELFLIAGASLDFETAPNLNVVVSVDDASLGGTPDDTMSYSLAVTNVVENLFVENDSYFTTVDTALSVLDPLVGVRTNDTVLGGAPYTGDITKVTDTQFGTLQLNDDGTFTYTPNAGFEGLDFFEYSIEDNDGNTATGTATIQVQTSVALVPTGEILVNQDSAPHDIADSQNTNEDGRGSDSAIAIARDGTKVVVWTSESGGSVADEVLLRLYDYRGIPIGDQQIVSNTTAGDQHSASVAIDGAGNFVVVWVSDSGGSDGQDIFARRFDATGQPIGDEFRVTDGQNTAGDQVNPDIAINDAGQFVIAWNGSGDGDVDGVFSRIYDSDGSDQSGVFRVNEATDGVQQLPSVGIDDAGNAVVGWIESADGNVGLRRFDSTGNLLNATVGPENVGTGLFVFGSEVIAPIEFQDISLAVRGDGVVSLAVTTILGNSGIPDVAIVALNPTLSNDWGGTVVNGSFMGERGAPSIAFLDNGDAIVVWEGRSNVSDVNDSDGVFARRFTLDTTGAVPFFASDGPEFTLNQTIAGSQSSVSVAALDADNFAVVWTGEGTGDSNGVFLRQFGTVEETFANDDTAVVIENESVTIQIADLLADDFDGFGSGLSFDAITQPANGTVTNNGDGTLTYTPEKDFNGTDAFTYSINSGAQTDVGTVHLAVTPANSAPDIAAAAEFQLTDVVEDPVAPSGTIVSTLLNSGGAGAIQDADPDSILGIAVTGLDSTNGRWQYSTDNGVTWQDFGVVSDQSATLLASDNVVRFLPDDDYFGSENSFTFRAWDQTQGSVGDTGFEIVEPGSPSAFSLQAVSAVQNVIGVNDAPVVGTVEAIEVDEDSADVVVDLSMIVSDLEDAELTFTVDGNSNNGLVSTLLNGEQLTLSFIPNQNGNATIFLRAVDSGNKLVDFEIPVVVNPINDEPVGTVAINGNLQEHQTLNANLSITDDDGVGFVSYQWLRDGLQIAGATGPNYTLVAADIGSEISVVATYTDNGGVLEEITSLAVGPIANTNDGPMGTVTITGDTTEDETLTVSNNISDLDGIVGSISYRWQRDNVDIAGANGSSYTLGDDDVGATISVIAFYTDGQGTDESVTSNFVGPVANVNDIPFGAVTITGDVVEDQTLTASHNLTDADGLGAVSYQWLRDGVVVAGATNSTYTLGDDDVGAQISVRASYVDGQFTAESVESVMTEAVVNVNDDPIGTAVVTGALTEDETVTADLSNVSDADGIGTISFQWLRDGVEITGANSASFALGDADVGTTISFVATYTDLNGTTETVFGVGATEVANVNDLPTGIVEILGNATEDQTLTATNSLADIDGLGTISYQWMRDGNVIAGATAASYTLGDDDVGATISVRASYTDGHGTAESVGSSAVGAVANVNDLPTGVVSIAGAAVEDSTLTASNNLTDADGLGTINYQWQRDGVDIAGATGSTYTLGDDDVGSSITVVGSYVDQNGTAESVSSAAVGAVLNVNDLPVGTVNISGTPSEDETLTASNNLTDNDGLGTVDYQWQRDGVDIAGATGSAYTLGDDDVGSSITVVGSYVDQNGTAESVSSSAVGAVLNVNDLPVGTVSISGTSTEDETLTASNNLTDNDGLGTINYQWQRDGVDIVGATGSTYTLGDDDVGSSITVVGSYVDQNGTAESVSSAAVGAVLNVNDLPVGTVNISGTPSEDETLTATNNLTDNDGLGTVDYQWQRDGVDIVGATGSAYTLGDDDVGSSITVVGSYVDQNGAAESVSSAAVGPVLNVNDVPVGTVNISGTPTEDETLTASNNLTDADGLGTINYQWQRDGVDIVGATGSTYTLGDDDVGSSITVVGSYVDQNGTAESVSSSAVGAVLNVNDLPVGTVSISGTSTEDETLTASNNLTDADGLGTINYQWQRDGVDIAGATGDTYTLGDDDVGSSITVVGSYVDQNGTAESVSSAAVGAVLNVNDLPVGTVSISGTLTEDETLTASNNLTDADGLGVINYQWQRDGVDVAGATGSTYTLGDDDVGSDITVVGSYVDQNGTTESVSSATVGAVLNVNDLPVGTVNISGSPTEDETLTASNNLTDIDGLGTINYQWQRDGVDIAGATGSTYTLGDDDVDSDITVVASYVDQNGASESVGSAAVGPVQNVNDAPTGVLFIEGILTENEILRAISNLTDNDNVIPNLNEDGVSTITHQWLRNGVEIVGATNATYLLGDLDVGQNISVVASYPDDRGTLESVVSSEVGPIANINDSLQGAVSIIGDATEDQTLTATNNITDADGLGTINYQWQRDGVNIAGATGETYTLGDEDVNSRITVVASYVDGFGTTESVASSETDPIANINDSPVGEVSINGAATEDEILTAVNNLTDDDGLGDINYQWQRNGVDIAGATDDTYLLGDLDVGQTINVVASYVDGHGTTESVSSAEVGSVANVNDAPLGAVSIVGDATEDQTLTAVNNLADADGLGTINYQWQRDGVDIAGATSDTYTLGDNDVDATVTVVVSYTDGFGTLEQVESVAVGPVVNVNDLPTGVVSIAGTPAEAETLTASNTLQDAEGIDSSIEYQWQRDGVDIAGATEATYEVLETDAGSLITVVASYTDGQGTLETVTSAAVGPIQNLNLTPTLSLTNIIKLLDENIDTSAGVQVADIVVNDDVDGVNNLSVIGDDSALFEIIGDQLFVRSGLELDFESQNSFDVSVQLDDAAIGTGVEGVVDYSLGLNDINETPFVTSDALAEFFATEDQTDLLIDLNDWFGDQDIADSQLDITVLESSEWYEAIVGPDNQLSIILTADQSGTSELVVRATDHQGLAVETSVNLVVTPQNDTVVIADQEFQSFGGEVVRGNLLDSILDADGEDLSIVVVEQPENGDLTIFDDGSFEFVPEVGFSGELSFKVVADDGVAVSDEAEIVIQSTVDTGTVILTETAPSSIVVTEAVEEIVVETEAETEQPAEENNGLVIGDSSPSTAADGLANGPSPTSPEAADSSGGQDELDAVNHLIVRNDAEPNSVEFLIERVARGVGIGSGLGATTELAYAASSYATENSSSLLVLVQPGLLWNELDAFKDSAESQASFDSIAIGSVGTVSSSLIVGYVVWALRSGLLLSSVVASMPVWNLLDPLAVVSVAEAGSEDSESLEDIVDGNEADANE